MRNRDDDFRGRGENDWRARRRGMYGDRDEGSYRGPSYREREGFGEHESPRAYHHASYGGSRGYTESEEPEREDWSRTPREWEGERGGSFGPFGTWGGSRGEMHGRDYGGSMGGEGRRGGMRGEDEHRSSGYGGLRGDEDEYRSRGYGGMQRGQGGGIREGEYGGMQPRGSYAGSQGQWTAEEMRRTHGRLERQPRGDELGTDMTAGRGITYQPSPADQQMRSTAARSMRGRGPKGYKRSDERIREDVCDRLCEGWADASDVTVDVHNGEVILSGTVEHRRDKLMIEQIAEDVSGVQDITNQIRVRRRDEQQQPATTQARGNGEASANRGSDQQRKS